MPAGLELSFVNEPQPFLHQSCFRFSRNLLELIESGAVFTIEPSVHVSLHAATVAQMLRPCYNGNGWSLPVLYVFPTVKWEFMSVVKSDHAVDFPVRFLYVPASVPAPKASRFVDAPS